MVQGVSEEHRRLVRDLFDTMYFAHGVGLAAPQVGVSERVLVIDLDPRGSRKPDEIEALRSQGFAGPQAFINPEIVHTEGELIWEEGCLSVPGINDEVKRADTVTIRALNLEGEVFEKTVSGLYAVAVQHELDHLNGKVFVEYLSRLKRELIKKKMVKLRRETDDYYADRAAEKDDAQDTAAL
jgi:peptide deformylase